MSNVYYPLGQVYPDTPKDTAAAEDVLCKEMRKRGWTYRIEYTPLPEAYPNTIVRYVYEVPVYKDVRPASGSLAQRVVNDHGNLNLTFDFIPLRPLMYKGTQTRGIVVDDVLYVDLDIPSEYR